MTLFLSCACMSIHTRARARARGPPTLICYSSQQPTFVSHSLDNYISSTSARILEDNATICGGKFYDLEVSLEKALYFCL